jgi:hypothetical protein
MSGRTLDGWVPLQREGFLPTPGFLAAVTKNIRLSSGVLIAPRRRLGLVVNEPVTLTYCNAGTPA